MKRCRPNLRCVETDAMFPVLPVLTYHSISRFEHHLCVSPERFEEHCRVLAKAGWRGVGLEEAQGHFLEKKRLARKTCLFSFDDGYLDNYVYAEPLLRQYGHQGVIFPVAGFMEEREEKRPNIECGGTAREGEPGFADLDSRPLALRSGRKVASITFCSWAELRHMQDAGNMAAAPHSMDHGRVVVSLTIKRLYAPKTRSSFFALPPHDLPYGFPAFKLGHALAKPGYTLAPGLFALIRNMVPQSRDAAKAFLDEPANYQSVLRAAKALPCLGTRESDREYRERIAGEFQRCRDIFREKLGKTPVSFCWPWGDFSKTALEEARNAGFRLFFTTRGKPSFLSGADAVYRITVRHQSGAQLLQRLRFASGAFGEGIGGWFGF